MTATPDATLPFVLDDGRTPSWKRVPMGRKTVTHGIPPVDRPATTRTGRRHTPAGGDGETTCEHCDQPLTRDDIWGWIHTGGRYLCYDPTTGEPLSLPASPAIA
jgi:hypothetical protein